MLRQISRTANRGPSAPASGVSSITAAPLPYPVDTNTRASPTSTGCDALTRGSVTQGYSHSRRPSTGVIAARRDADSTTICRTPPIVTSIGDEYDVASSSADQAMRPVAMS